ncbi:hypothetical protein GCM10029976_057330 [Kribbella albertanoniae]
MAGDRQLRPGTCGAGSPAITSCLREAAARLLLALQQAFGFGYALGGLGGYGFGGDDEVVDA